MSRGSSVAEWMPTVAFALWRHAYEIGDNIRADDGGKVDDGRCQRLDERCLG